MLRLNQNGKNCFTITDGADGQVQATKEELNGLYQQLIKVKSVLPQEKENTHTVILENDWNGDGEKVQMKLSDSAYRLLCFLHEEGWLCSDDIRFTEVSKNFERFV